MRGGALAHAQVRARLRQCEMGPAVGGRPLPRRHPAWHLHLRRIAGRLWRPEPDVPVLDGGLRRRRWLARNVPLRSPLGLFPSFVADLDPRGAWLSGRCTRDTPGALARAVASLAQQLATIERQSRGVSGTALAAAALCCWRPWRQTAWRQVGLRLADLEGVGGPPFRSPLEPIGRRRSQRRRRRQRRRRQRQRRRRRRRGRIGTDGTDTGRSRRRSMRSRGGGGRCLSGRFLHSLAAPVRGSA